MAKIKAQGRKELSAELAQLAQPERASFLQGFFKTGPGEYAEGDGFLGIPVPQQRKVALRYRHLPLQDIERLLRSPLHEERFCALEILVCQYEHADQPRKDEIFRFYLDHTGGINNWDLVDTSAPYIVGEHLVFKSRKILDELAKSENMWERRIAIVATLGLIRHKQTDSAFRISRALLGDKHSLVHKAVGWVLRETGKISDPDLVAFLRKHYQRMPRTALRYAIERFEPERRKRILSGDFDDE